MTTYSKLPPQAIEAEQLILGSIMLEEKAMHDVVETLRTPEAFYADAHQRIYRGMLQLYQAHTRIDIITLREQLQKNADIETIGGPMALMELSNRVTNTGNLEEYAKIVVEKYILRKLITVTGELNRAAYDETTDAFALLDKAGNQVDEVNMLLNGQSNESFASRVINAANLLKNAAVKGTYLTGVPTFSNNLDKQLLGFQPSDFIIVAARPAMGKTSIVWHIAKNQAKNNIPVGFFSLEMNDVQLINKMFAAETGIDLKTIRCGGMRKDEWQKFDNTAEAMMQYPIYLNDTGGLGIHQLIAVAKNWVRKHGVKVIYIDYIQLITADNPTGAGNTRRFGTREQEVSYISQKLKATAKELNVPIVALAQLSRGPESRDSKRPLLSDLRESGAIEQDADIVIFPFRPEYYGFSTDSATGSFLPDGLTILDIAKFRNGQVGEIQWLFDKRHSLFTDVVLG